MAVAPEEILAAAKELAQGSREVDWRNAASRGYYAAYHRCMRLAREERLHIQPTASEHIALVEGLKRIGNAAPLRKLGAILDQCRLRRRKADYQVEGNFERYIADTVIEDSRETISVADGF